MSRVQECSGRMISRYGFLGVPVDTFEKAGRQQFTALLKEGLNPESKVLDIGCGCLRTAYWLIRFLDTGCYPGIEPARVRVEYGLRYLFTPEILEQKQPRLILTLTLIHPSLTQSLIFFWRDPSGAMQANDR